MPLRLSKATIAGFLAGLICHVCHTDAASPVTVLENARIYKVLLNSNDQWADALAYNQETGKIIAVGTLTDVKAEAASIATDASSITTLNLNGRLVLPGFQDAHIHAIEAGLNEGLCYFDADPPFNEWKYYFEDCPNSGTFGDQGWFVGAGIDIVFVLEEVLFNNQDFPRVVLDRAFPNDPVLILDNLGHGAIANTKALEMVGYTQMQGNPLGGKLDRDPATNQLTGVLLESAQQPLRDAAFPANSAANQQKAYQSLLEAQKVLAANGITSVSDAGGFWRQAQVGEWARAEKAGDLTVRASNALYIYPDVPIDDQLTDLKRLFSDNPDQLSNLNQAKIYVDGILGVTTAALSEPFLAKLELPSDEELGFEYFGDAATLNNVATKLYEAGFQLHFHAVGDRGVSLALDAIAQLPNDSTNSQTTTRPHRITHCYMISANDRPRFQELGVVADFQWAPSSVTTEYKFFLASEILGETRASNIMPAVDVYNAGALIIFSSDWDADTLSPIVKIQTLLHRPTGGSFDNVEQVLPFMTRNPAELLGTATGTIEVGKFADLVVLSSNILEAADTSTLTDTTRVEMTIFNGKVIFDPLGATGTPIGEFPKDEDNDDSSSRSLYECTLHYWISSLLLLAISISYF